MTFSLRPPFVVSFPFARMFSGLMLLGFLFCTYWVVRTEVEVRRQGTPIATPPSLREVQKAPPAKIGNQPSTKTAPAKPKPRRSEIRLKPSQREGSRREWYEKRKRRWFTPPERKLDKGLPKSGGRFKMA